MEPVHVHDLILGDKGEGDDGALKNCRGCKEKIRGDKASSSSYYWYCTLCKYCFHEGCAKLPLQIKHFFHPCPLFLHFSPGFICNSCFGRLSDVYTYRCEQCDFDMCVECATREVSSLANCQHILDCCHRHPLQPLMIPSKSNSLLSSSCQICNMPCSSTPDCWGCEPCNFHIHKYCLDFLPETVQLKLGSQVVASWILQTIPTSTCTDCDKAISSKLVFRRVGEKPSKYLCIFCCLLRRLIGDGKPSSQVPKAIDHFFHPCPNLKLTLSPSSTCNACFLNHHRFSYHCDSCDFFLCFNCSKLSQLANHEKEANQLVQHFCHWHPLKLFVGATYSKHICNLCEKICSGQFLGCNDNCGFYIHKSCMDSLPQKMVYPLFNEIAILLPLLSFKCSICSRQRSGLAFHNSNPHCNLCVKCVLWPDNVNGDAGRLRSFLHWHQMSLYEAITKDKKKTCFLCKECCIGWTYKCCECDYFFHKACAELPEKLDHPIHPRHRLTLTKRSSLYPNVAMTCGLCLRNFLRDFPIYDWVYMCDQCGFQFDTQCASCLPSLEYKGHPHLLYVVPNMHGERNCGACRKSCKGSSTILCAECDDFSLHLSCGPLPGTIKHALHVHPLALQDYYVEDNGSDEFACHICEEERDPRLRVYCCSQGCLMICDIQCVLNEVLPLLRGERGQVELRTPFPQVECRVINYKSVSAVMNLDSGDGDGNQKIKYGFSAKELLDSLSADSNEEDEEAREKITAKSDDKAKTTFVQGESSKTGTSLDSEVESYSFSWKAMSHFNRSLRTLSTVDLQDDFLKQYDGSTVAGDYALPEILGPIYEEFFGKYNIIDEYKCKLNYSQRRAMIFITCSVLHQMRIIKVVDATKEAILQWLGWTRYVEDKAGFNVGIVAENIKRVWQAHYYIQSKKIVDDKTQRIEQELEQVCMYEAELRTEMDELWYKMEEARARHRELQRMEKEHEIYRVEGSKGPMKKAKSDALDIKWRTCYDSLVTYLGNMPAK